MPSTPEERRHKRMEWIDAQPPEIRTLVNEYGYHVVHTLWGCGVRTHGQIRHIVEAILDEFSPTRGTRSRANKTAPITVEADDAR